MKFSQRKILLIAILGVIVFGILAFLNLEPAQAVDPDPIQFGAWLSGEAGTIAAERATGVNLRPNGDPVVNAITTVLGWIILPLVTTIGNLLGVLIRLLVSVAQYNDFIHAYAVSIGWILIRDICNMFFIVVLIVIAFCTVLRIEQYSYKKLLGSLLLAAILVNFSKGICGLIIDFSQVITLTFVNAFRAAAEGNFATMLGLDHIMAVRTGNLENEHIGGIQTVGALILGLIITIVGVIVVAIITIIFIGRIITLWFLVIFSPIAFVANILPTFQRYANDWWQRFTSQVIVGPILAFGLWLSLAVVQKSWQNAGNSPDQQMDLLHTSGGENVASARSSTTQSTGGVYAAISKIGEAPNLLNFVVGIAMLIGSLAMAQQMGVAGGKMAGNWAGKMQSWGKGAAKLPGKAAWGTVKATGAPQMAKEVWQRGLRAINMSSEQRETRKLRREGRIAEKWGGKRGARILAEEKIRHLERKRLEEEIGPLKSLSDGRLEILGRQSPGIRKDILIDELARRNKLKKEGFEDIERDIERKPEDRDLRLDFVQQIADLQGGALKYYFQMNYRRDDDGRWRKLDRASADSAIRVIAEAQREKIFGDIQKKYGSYNVDKMSSLSDSDIDVGRWGEVAAKILIALDPDKIAELPLRQRDNIIKQLDKISGEDQGIANENISKINAALEAKKKSKEEGVKKEKEQPAAEQEAPGQTPSEPSGPKIIIPPGVDLTPPPESSTSAPTSEQPAVSEPTPTTKLDGLTIDALRGDSEFKRNIATLVGDRSGNISASENFLQKEKNNTDILIALRVLKDQLDRTNIRVTTSGARDEAVDHWRQQIEELERIVQSFITDSSKKGLEAHNATKKLKKTINDLKGQIGA